MYTIHILKQGWLGTEEFEVLAKVFSDTLCVIDDVRPTQNEKSFNRPVYMIATIANDKGRIVAEFNTDNGLTIY